MKLTGAPRRESASFQPWRPLGSLNEAHGRTAPRASNTWFRMSASSGVSMKLTGAPRREEFRRRPTALRPVSMKLTGAPRRESDRKAPRSNQRRLNEAHGRTAPRAPQINFCLRKAEVSMKLTGAPRREVCTSSPHQTGVGLNEAHGRTAPRDDNWNAGNRAFSRLNEAHGRTAPRVGMGRRPSLS